MWNKFPFFFECTIDNKLSLQKLQVSEYSLLWKYLSLTILFWHGDKLSLWITSKLSKLQLIGEKNSRKAGKLSITSFQLWLSTLDLKYYFWLYSSKCFCHYFIKFHSKGKEQCINALCFLQGKSKPGSQRANGNIYCMHHIYSVCKRQVIEHLQACI